MKMTLIPISTRRPLDPCNTMLDNFVGHAKPLGDYEIAPRAGVAPTLAITTIDTEAQS